MGWPGPGVKGRGDSLFVCLFVCLLVYLLVRLLVATGHLVIVREHVKKVVHLVVVHDTHFRVAVHTAHRVEHFSGVVRHHGFDAAFAAAALFGKPQLLTTQGGERDRDE